MINRSSIKIIIAVLFIAGLSVALYLRRPKDTGEPNWDKGYLNSAERLYYNNHINVMINKWMDAGNRAQGKHDSNALDTLLVIDLDKKAIWIEENGLISEEYVDFPLKINWIFYHLSGKSNSLQKGRIILKNADDKTALKNPEQILLIGFGTKGSLSYTIIDTSNQLRVQGVYVNPPGPVVASTNIDDLQSPFIVTKDEYQNYINSQADSNTLQTDKENALASEVSLLEKNKAEWRKIEKKLYMEIQRNAGYQLTSIDVKPASDFSSAAASIIVFLNNPVTALLKRNDNMFANLDIVRLDDNVWYAVSDSNLQNTLSNRQLKLEFLILLNDDKITPLQKKEFINKGREKIKTIRFLQP